MKNILKTIFGKKTVENKASVVEESGEYYDLYPMLCELVDLLREESEKKGLTYALDMAWSTPKQLYGDEAAIKQAVEELIIQAVECTQNGKLVFTVAFTKDEDEPDIAMMEFGVMCSGKGIEQERLAALNEMLKSMGCALKTENVSDLGAKYHFSLKQGVAAWEPLGSFESMYKAELKSRTTERTGFIAPQAKVLVVDDNPMNLEVIKSLLENTKVLIDTAESGDTGIKLSSEREYDIVFIDHMMPDKDGIETLRELREKSRNKQSVMVCLTANAISGARKWYLSEGFDDYIAKPVSSEKLEDILLKHLPDDKIIKGATVYNG
ncbi:MAG: response regulator [Lachnospiraceae bacterium]|nr:response regulator [Lachnospiraceae bacterium]